MQASTASAWVPPPEKKRPFLGKAVSNRKIRYLSVSQVVRFDHEQVNGCQRAWTFEKVERKKYDDETEANKKGSKLYAPALEHYLLTGEPVLPPELLAAKHLFPQPGADIQAERHLARDIEKAVQLRDALLKPENAPGYNMIATELRRWGGLVICDIPFDGAFDFRHWRGEFIDESGILRREDPGMLVIETGDLKTTSRINDHTSRTGKLYKGYAKTSEQVGHHPQMIGYALQGIAEHPNATHHRLSHIYAQTKHGLVGVKRTVLLTREEVMRRGARLESIVRQMIDVAATVTDANKVPANPAACNAYGRECPHASYCNRPQGTVFDLFGIRTQGETRMAGLFDNVPGNAINGAAQQSLFNQAAPSPVASTPAIPAAPAAQGLFSTMGQPQAPQAAQPPPPSMNDAEREAAIAAERARLAAGTMPAALPAQAPSVQGAIGFPLANIDGYKLGQLCNGRGWYASSNGQGFIAVEVGHKCPGCPQLPAQHIGSINPPDQPPLDPVASAAPLSQEIIATIADPEVRGVATAHAQAHAERTAADEKAADKKNGRCPGGGQRVALDNKQMMATESSCPHCGKVFKGKKRQDALEAPDSGGVFFVVPKHNLDAATAAPAAPATAAPTPPPPSVASVAGAIATVAAADPATIAAAVTMPPPPPPPAIAPPPPPTVASVLDASTSGPLTQGITLLIDIVTERGEQPKSLDDYINDVVATLTKAAGLADLRYAPNNHDLAFGRWKGALAACVRHDPPKPGRYVVRNLRTSEFAQVVVEALAPFCISIERGVG